MHRILVVAFAVAAGTSALAQVAIAPPPGGPSCDEFTRMDAGTRLQALASIEPLGGEINGQDADAAQQWSDQVFSACVSNPDRSVAQAAADRLPSNVGYSWTGMSYQEQIVGNQAIFIFALSILLVYLVLAALYESWTNPFAVIMAVPLALLGVVGGMIARGFANDMYCQIGIVLMIAMAAKNAILVVEFARGEREKGVPLAQAAINAAHERFRPIMMTSLAFILGMLPLASAQGAGAAGQQVLGTAVLGGMITATLFNNLFVPPFYVILQGLSEWLGGGRNARNEASSPAASPPAMPPPAMPPPAMPTEQA